MDTDTPAATAPARKSNSSGCVMLFAVFAGLVISGLLWNLIAGGDAHSRHVTRSDYGSYWPLTVNSATIGCAGSEPYAQVGSTRYALNGAAESDGYPALDPVWADDPATPGLKLDVSVLRLGALKLC